METFHIRTCLIFTLTKTRKPTPPPTAIILESSSRSNEVLLRCFLGRGLATFNPDHPLGGLDFAFDLNIGVRIVLHLFCLLLCLLLFCLVWIGVDGFVVESVADNRVHYIEVGSSILLGPGTDNRQRCVCGCGDVTTIYKPWSIP